MVALPSETDSDLLVHRGHAVLHIQTEGPAEPHPLNRMAKGAGEGLIIPLCSSTCLTEQPALPMIRAISGE